MARPRIMLVEPMKWLRDVEEEVLVRAGYHPCLVGSKADAMRTAQHHVPAAIISRYVLPDGTGVALFLALREAGIYAPFIGLAGRAQHEEDYAEAGVRHVVTLPFHVVDLLSKISAVLSPVTK